MIGYGTRVVTRAGDAGTVVRVDSVRRALLGTGGRVDRPARALVDVDGVGRRYVPVSELKLEVQS